MVLKVEILQNNQVIETKDLTDGSHKIGRNPECAIVLSSQQVSKQHALLVIQGNKAAVVDVGSSNGVFVNGVLIKKQRVHLGDKIQIGNFTLRLGSSAHARASAQAPAFDGNAALAQEPMSMEEPKSENVQEKLLRAVDNRILIPFYAILKTFDWRWVLTCILLGALGTSVVLTVIPILRWAETKVENEALERAHTLVTQVVRENYRILSKTNDATRLTVESAENESGILSLVVMDPKTNGVLAPTKEFNKTINDAYSLIAIKKIVEKKEEKVSVPHPDGTFIVAQPISIYSADANERVLSAIVLGVFQVQNGLTTTFQPLVEALLFACVFSLIAFFLIYKMMTYPIVRLQRQLDGALKGETVHFASEIRWPELEELAQSIQFSVGKLTGNVVQEVNSDDLEAEQNDYLKVVKELDEGCSDGLLVLDRDKKVKFVGQVLEELLSLRNQYAQGQNISDACKDPSFAGTVIDMAENVIRSLGESTKAQLEVNGIFRTLVGVGHKNKAGDVQFILVTVKMVS